jgi:hypothetical protein
VRTIMSLEVAFKLLVRSKRFGAPRVCAYVGLRARRRVSFTGMRAELMVLGKYLIASIYRALTRQISEDDSND